MVQKFLNGHDVKWVSGSDIIAHFTTITVRRRNNRVFMCTDGDRARISGADYLRLAGANRVEIAIWEELNGND